MALKLSILLQNLISSKLKHAYDARESSANSGHPFKSYDGDKIWIHTYIHINIHFFKPFILTQEPQKNLNSSKSLSRKFSPLQSFLFEKALL